MTETILASTAILTIILLTTHYATGARYHSHPGRPCSWSTPPSPKNHHGWFMCFASDHNDYRAGPGHIPVAICEEANSGRIHIVPADAVTFTNPRKHTERT